MGDTGRKLFYSRSHGRRSRTLFAGTQCHLLGRNGQRLCRDRHLGCILLQSTQCLMQAADQFIECSCRLADLIRTTKADPMCEVVTILDLDHPRLHEQQRSCDRARDRNRQNDGQTNRKSQHDEHQSDTARNMSLGGRLVITDSLVRQLHDFIDSLSMCLIVNTHLGDRLALRFTVPTLQCGHELIERNTVKSHCGSMRLVQQRIREFIGESRLFPIGMPSVVIRL